VFILYRSVAGIPSAHGVGLQPDREPAREYAHAHEYNGQYTLYPLACSKRDSPHDLLPHIDRRDVGRRGSSRSNKQRPF
jgi:hypothetical protein